MSFAEDRPLYPADPYLEISVANYHTVAQWQLYAYSIRFSIDLAIESLFLYRLVRHPLVRHQYFAKLLAPFFVSDITFTLQCTIQCILNTINGSYFLGAPGCLWQVMYVSLFFALDQATLVLAAFAAYRLLRHGEVFSSKKLNWLRLACVVHSLIAMFLSSFWPSYGVLRASGAYCFPSAHTIVGAFLTYGFILGSPLVLQMTLFARSLLYTRAVRRGALPPRPGLAQHMYLARVIAVFPLVYVCTLILVVISHLWEWAAGMRQAPATLDYFAVFNGHAGTTTAGFAMMYFNIPFRLAVLDTPGIRQATSAFLWLRRRLCPGCCAGRHAKRRAAAAKRRAANRNGGGGGGDGGRSGAYSQATSGGGRAMSLGRLSLVGTLHDASSTPLEQVLRLLAQPPLREAFTQYLKHCFCLESLLFIDRVEELHRMRRPRAWTGDDGGGNGDCSSPAAGGGGGGEQRPLLASTRAVVSPRTPPPNRGRAFSGDSGSTAAAAPAAPAATAIVAPLTLPPPNLLAFPALNSPASQLSPSVAMATAERVVAACDDILATFVVEGSELQVNLAHSIRSAVEQTVRSDAFRAAPCVTVFDEAEEAVAAMLRSDVIPRFGESTQYQAVCGQLTLRGASLA